MKRIWHETIGVAHHETVDFDFVRDKVLRYKRMAQLTVVAWYDKPTATLRIDMSPTMYLPPWIELPPVKRVFAVLDSRTKEQAIRYILKDVELFKTELVQFLKSFNLSHMGNDEVKALFEQYGGDEDVPY